MIHDFAQYPFEVYHRIVATLRVSSNFIIFYIIVALVFFKIDKNFAEKKLEVKSLFRYLLPQKIREKSSFKLDFHWFLLSFLNIPSLLSKLLVTFTFLNFLPLIIERVVGTKGSALIHVRIWFSNIPTHEFILFFIALVVFDFGTFFAHWLSHRYKFLWQFHKAHHYGEQLNYFAGDRSHPVDSVFVFNTGVLFMSVFVSLLSPISNDVFSGPASLASNHRWLFYAFIFYPAFINSLNHSHFPISFGKFFNRIFVSPSYHWIHHSKAVHNTNLGQLFSFWDELFGTQKLPFTAAEEVDHREIFGVKEMGDLYYKNIFQWLYIPFVDAALVLKENFLGLFSKTVPEKPPKTSCHELEEAPEA